MKTHLTILLLLLLVFAGGYEGWCQTDNNYPFQNVKSIEAPKLALKLELFASPGLVLEPKLTDNLTLSAGVGTRMIQLEKDDDYKNTSFVYNPKLFIEGRYYFMEWVSKDATYDPKIYNGAYVALHLATSLDKDVYDKNDNCVLFGVQKSFFKRMYANLGIGIWVEKSAGATKFNIKIPLGLGFILK
jgi:hypothetical protein